MPDKGVAIAVGVTLFAFGVFTGWAVRSLAQASRDGDEEQPPGLTVESPPTVTAEEPEEVVPEEVVESTGRHAMESMRTRNLAGYRKNLYKGGGAGEAVARTDG